MGQIVMGGDICDSLVIQRAGLLVDLVVDDLGSLGLLGRDEGADPGQGLVTDDNGRDDGSLAVANVAALLIILDLGRVDVEDVVAALKGLVVGQQDEALGVGVELAGGLLDEGEALVEAVERLVAERVDAGDVGRDVLVGLGEVGQDGGGEGLVGRVAELEGALGILVGLEGVDAVADERVVQQVLLRSARGTDVPCYV